MGSISVLAQLVSGRTRFDIKNLDESQWREIVNLSATYGVSPLIYRNIRVNGLSGEPPPEEIEKLYRSYLANAARNVFFYDELKRLTGVLSNENISLIVLKGCHLAEAVYGDIALRRMADIDILVKKSDFAGSVKSLLDNGYRFFGDARSGSKNVPVTIPPRIQPGHRHFPPVYYPGSKIMIELHLSIADQENPFNIDLEGLWRRSSTESIAGLQINVLCPEDLVLCLALHLAYYDLFGNGLRKLWDIAAVINHYRDRIDWDRVWKRASQWRMERCLVLALLLTEKVFGQDIFSGSIPMNYTMNYTPHVPAACIDDAFARLFKCRCDIPVDSVLYRLRKTHGVSAKLKYILRRFFPSREAMYVDGLSFLKGFNIYSHYCLRLKRAAGISANVLHRLYQQRNSENFKRRKHHDAEQLKPWLENLT